jgi:hypothetical protein
MRAEPVEFCPTGITVAELIATAAAIKQTTNKQLAPRSADVILFAFL